MRYRPTHVITIITYFLTTKILHFPLFICRWFFVRSQKLWRPNTEDDPKKNGLHKYEIDLKLLFISILIFQSSWKYRVIVCACLKKWKMHLEYICVHFHFLFLFKWTQLKMPVFFISFLSLFAIAISQRNKIMIFAWFHWNRECLDLCDTL